MRIFLEEFNENLNRDYLQISISEMLKGNNMDEIPSGNVNTVYNKMQQTDTYCQDHANELALIQKVGYQC